MATVVLLSVPRAGPTPTTGHSFPPAKQLGARAEFSTAGFNGSVASVAVLVEGQSDRAAVLALAAAGGIDLAACGVLVVPMGGITNIARHLAELGPCGTGLRVTGLYDAGEERFVRQGLERAGLAPAAGSAGLAALGFHRCDRDLEDELIRALGADRVVETLAAHGDLVPFRTLQHQPFHRGGSTADHLHRFLGAGSGRKVRYGRLLVEALTPHEVPAPLAAVLSDALAMTSS